VRTAWTQLTIITRRTFEVHDITGEVLDRIRSAALHDGLVHIASRHTTAAVAVNEFDPALMRDLEQWLAGLAPAGRAWAHDARARTIPGEPENTPAHLKAMLLGWSQTVAVVGGALQLGTWQRILFVELDGPRQRTVSLTMLGHFLTHDRGEGV
jgi:secondary thiamine-phosphate synthase enzyme